MTVLPRRLLFFPLDIVTEGADRVPDREGRSRKERDILVLAFGKQQRNRRQADHGGSSPGESKRPDDRDDAAVPDPACTADDEVAAPFLLTHPEHLSLIPDGAAA